MNPPSRPYYQLTLLPWTRCRLRGRRDSECARRNIVPKTLKRILKSTSTKCFRFATTSLIYPPTPFVSVLWQHIDCVEKYFPKMYLHAKLFFIPPHIQKYPGKSAAKLTCTKFQHFPPSILRRPSGPWSPRQRPRGTWRYLGALKHDL